MRITRTALVTALLVLNPLGLQGAGADGQADQKQKLSVTEAFQVKLERLHNRLLALPIEKSEMRARTLGFDSVAQLMNAQLDAERRLRVFFVGLNSLQAYRNETDPWPLLQPTNTFIYPIVTPNKDNKTIIVSGVLVQDNTNERSKEADYHFSQLGESLSVPIRVLNKARENLLAKLSNCDFFVISIPALNKQLLGVHRQSTCDFVVIDLDWVRGLDNFSIQPAKTVFKALSEEARTDKYDMPLETDSHSVPDQ
jgi:hypothetical protein